MHKSCILIEAKVHFYILFLVLGTSTVAWSLEGSLEYRVFSEGLIL